MSKNATFPYLHRITKGEKREIENYNLHSCENPEPFWLWKLLYSTYFYSQASSVSAFKPWSAFADDLDIMGGKWPVKLFSVAKHFAYIMAMWDIKKSAKNEVQ